MEPDAIARSYDLLAVGQRPASLVGLEERRLWRGKLQQVNAAARTGLAPSLSTASAADREAAAHSNCLGTLPGVRYAHPGPEGLPSHNWGIHRVLAPSPSTRPSLWDIWVWILRSIQKLGLGIEKLGVETSEGLA